jgi:hypothetical protein
LTCPERLHQTPLEFQKRKNCRKRKIVVIVRVGFAARITKEETGMGATPRFEQPNKGQWAEIGRAFVDEQFLSTENA